MSFQSLELPEYLLKAIEARSYTSATAIQEQAIPLILEGRDIIAEAQTGTGKTAAFALPIIQLLNEREAKKKKISIQSLTLVPTRELAIQVAESFKAYAQFSPKELKVRSIIGGEDIQDQISSLRMGVDIIVATPGRLIELIELGEVRLREMHSLILDEADKMLDLGFQDELKVLLTKLPENRQNLLFSATFGPKLIKLSEELLNEPSHVQVEAQQTTVEAIDQRIIQVDSEKRRPLLQHLIKTQKWQQAIVFVASQRAADNLATKMRRDRISAEAFHGGLDQEDRIEILREFKSNDVRILIATDIAARGIDIAKLPYVVNYDLPRSPLDYVHRIGRTGRAGEGGTAITFVDHETEYHFRTIEKRAGIRLPREQVEGFEITGERPTRVKGPAPVKGKRKSKKDKLREQAAREAKKKGNGGI